LGSDHEKERRRDRRSGRRDRRARSAPRAEARGCAVTDGVDPAGAHRHARSARRPGAPWRLGADGRRSVPCARRHPGPGAAPAQRRLRRAHSDHAPARAVRAGRRARLELPLHPGAAGHRQDVDGREYRRRSHSPRAARGRGRHEPQGDSQSAR
jgi:hypothetical protein